jgi:hypothetical protein
MAPKSTPSKKCPGQVCQLGRLNLLQANLGAVVGWNTLRKLAENYRFSSP